jgi:hypothetical protein
MRCILADQPPPEKCAPVDPKPPCDAKLPPDDEPEMPAPLECDDESDEPDCDDDQRDDDP